MSASRKDFVKIAESVRMTLDACSEGIDRLAVVALARMLAVDLSGMNDNFNRSRFLTACGLTTEEMNR